MASPTRTAAAFDDSYSVHPKATLIAGMVLRFMPGGDAPNSAALEIVVSLPEHSRRTGTGVLCTVGLGFALNGH